MNEGFGTFVRVGAALATLLLVASVLQAEPPQLLILTAEADQVSGTILIQGRNFLGAKEDDSVVSLADVPLVIQSVSDTEIWAELPVGVVPGTYLLTVSRGKAKAKNDAFNLTIGAVGPPGPQGEVGPQGPRGWVGPQGPAGLLASFDEVEGLPCTVRGSVGAMAIDYDSSFVASLRCAISAVCGDNLAEAAERCDGTDLRGQDCLSQGFSSGTLQCVSDCTDYDTSMCTAGCESNPPLVSIINPSTGPLPGTSTTIIASATDADSGVKEVRFWYQYCPGPTFICQPRVLIGVDGTGPSPYTINWSFPNCGFDNQKFSIIAEAEDNCGNISSKSVVEDIVLGGRGC